VRTRAPGGALVGAVLVALTVVLAPAAGASVAQKGGSGNSRWLGSRTTEDGVTLRVSAAPFDQGNLPSNLPASCFPDRNVILGVSTDRIAETANALFRLDDPQPVVQTVTGLRGTGSDGSAQIVVARVPEGTERVEARFANGVSDDAKPFGRWAVLAQRVESAAYGRTARTRVVRLTSYGADDRVLERLRTDGRSAAQFFAADSPECQSSAGGTVTPAQPVPTPLPDAVGPPPADEAAAHDAVVAAVEGAYAAGGGGDTSLTHVEGGDSAAVRAAQELAASRNPQYRGKVAASVTELKFLDDTEAAIRFDLLVDGRPLSSGRVGFVVLTPDGWKLSRSTYCALLSSGGAQC
jgi:hypothetical protein